MARIIILFLRIFSFVFFLQPRKVQLFWGNSLGSLLFFLKFRAKVIPGELQRQEKYFRASYQSLGNLILEILMLFGSMRRFVLSRVDFIGKEHADQVLKEGKGFFFLSSHLGNWEVMAAAGGLIGKFDLMLVTKRLKPEWLHQAITQWRLECQVKATYEPKTVKDILTHLKKNGAVGFVLDQFAGAPIGVRVPLFGVPVGTPLALATLVKRTGTPVLPVQNYRKSDGRWAVVISPPKPWIEHPDSHYELALNTAEYVSVLESHIRENPEQWLWTHRRFKGDLSPLKENEWSIPRVRK